MKTENSQTQEKWNSNPCFTMDLYTDSEESGSMTDISTTSSTMDNLRTPDSITKTNPFNFNDSKTYGVITNMNVPQSKMGIKSLSTYELQRQSNIRPTPDSLLDHTLLHPSPGHHSMTNLGTENIQRTSYNMATMSHDRLKNAHRGAGKRRHASVTSNLETDACTCGLTKHSDTNSNISCDTGNMQTHEKVQNRNEHLDLRPIQRNSPYPLWKFSKSKKPPETVLDVAYRTILDYKHPVTLHRQPKADRQMDHYDYLPSIKVFSEEDHQKREAMRFQLKYQLQMEEKRKRQEILEMERDILPESEREENVQKSIFLPSGEEYEFSDGDISTATLPVPSPRGERRSSTSSHHSSRSIHKPNSPRPVSSRRSSHDIHVSPAKSPPYTVSVMPPPSPSSQGSKRRHSVSTLVRRQKMFNVVSHWPGMGPNTKLYEIEEPSTQIISEEDSNSEMPKPPPIHHTTNRGSPVRQTNHATPVNHAHHRSRNSRMLSHTEHKTVQKGAPSLTREML
ncbi:uncharacterized protein LOC110985243 [Acanthaster planci]|uniref:Uncharacterized protein LOC110985243 n=1 Tax=Acanthaster planci TaxID=133434 RepID=A0A8B7ZA22_ACAPL|nr:uncharacterized protein LOC110985243 [Acanthaster planci]XP_022101818.1 uncharacterized protein LOC110985243 [Acanthaster planci]